MAGLISVKFTCRTLRTLNIGRSLYNINKFVGNKVTSDVHFGD